MEENGKDLTWKIVKNPTLYLPVCDAILPQFFSHVPHKDPRVGTEGAGVADRDHKLVESMAGSVGSVQLGKDDCVGGHLPQVACPALGGLQVWGVQDELLRGDGRENTVSSVALSATTEELF